MTTTLEHFEAMTYYYEGMHAAAVRPGEEKIDRCVRIAQMWLWLRENGTVEQREAFTRGTRHTIAKRG